MNLNFSPERSRVHVAAEPQPLEHRENEDDDASNNSSSGVISFIRSAVHTIHHDLTTVPSE
jgi:hypothetical protein